MMLWPCSVPGLFERASSAKRACAQPKPQPKGQPKPYFTQEKADERRRADFSLRENIRQEYKAGVYAETPSRHPAFEIGTIESTPRALLRYHPDNNPPTLAFTSPIRGSPIGVVALVSASTGVTVLCVGFVLFLLYPVKWTFVWLARRTGSLEKGSPCRS